MFLKDRVAVVTGAGRGIGQAIALAFAAEGAAVVLAARTADELAMTEARVRSMNAACMAVPTDVAKREDVDRMVHSALDQFGRIDVLVNNAGIQLPIGPLVENDEEAWLRTLEVNLMGPLRCMRRVLPAMMERRSGKIVNLSGGGATSPRPNFSAYGVSKAALIRLTETVAEEVREFNIQVNAVAPGAVNTSMLEEVLKAGPRAGIELESARRRRIEGGIPPELAARLVVFLASESSGSLTGKLISAPHDNWQNWDPAEIARLNETPWFTLRRMDEYTLRRLSSKTPQ
jgi:3-oxoacyl-[acyl-carrier protein] reductase